MEKFAKLASLGAMAVGGGTLALYVLLLFVFRPVANGGIDGLGYQVLAIAMFVPVAIIAGAHVAFSRQLNAGPQPIRG
ncbi:MAG: hypothetical protein HY084_09160 [Gemmatimonadetes bacterium]|nr:hypothetical protein [Gemmatimonadota bacterium]